jgi:O-antigen/teichoic acid export membrane protein
VALWTKLFSTSALISLFRVLGAGVGFATQILLARLLEPAEIGLFYFLSSIAMIGGLIAAHGYPSIMTRFVSRYRERGQKGHLSAFLRRARREALIWSLSAALGLAVAGLFWPGLDLNTRIAFILSVLAIAPMALHRVYSSVTMAYRQFMASYLPGFFVRPLLFALALGAMLLMGAKPSVAEVSALSLAAFVAAFIMLYVLVIGKLREATQAKPTASARLQRRWSREAWPLVMVAAFTGLLSDLAVFAVTPFISLAEVAEFGICLKIGFLVGFTVQVSHQVILPDLGDAMARRERGTMRAKIIGASLFPVALTVLGVLASIAFGDRLLGLFGDEFRSAQNTLTIIMVAQLVRALAGPGPILLNLKGAQAASAWICVASLVVLIASSALFASLWQAEGAALAIVVTTIFWLVATAVVLYRIDGARTDLAGLVFMSRELAAAED